MPPCRRADPLPPRDPLERRVAALAELPGVAERAEAAREACTRLRFDEALRRRIPEAAGESRIRGAQASAALDGADVPLARVRDLVTGAGVWPVRPDPVDQALRGVVQATAETEHVVGVVLTGAAAGAGPAARRGDSGAAAPRAGGPAAAG